jgi:CrcB protein
VVNLAGCFLIGVLGARVGPDTLVRLGLGTGVLGGFTTFSTLAVETDRGIDAARPGLALAVLAVSLGGGIGLAALGARVGGEAT